MRSDDIAVWGYFAGAFCVLTYWLVASRRQVQEIKKARLSPKVARIVGIRWYEGFFIAAIWPLSILFFVWIKVAGQARLRHWRSRQGGLRQP